MRAQFTTFSPPPLPRPQLQHASAPRRASADQRLSVPAASGGGGGGGGGDSGGGPIARGGWDPRRFGRADPELDAASGGGGGGGE